MKFINIILDAQHTIFLIDILNDYIENVDDNQTVKNILEAIKEDYKNGIKNK